MFSLNQRSMTYFRTCESYSSVFANHSNIKYRRAITSAAISAAEQIDYPQVQDRRLNNTRYCKRYLEPYKSAAYQTSPCTWIINS